MYNSRTGTNWPVLLSYLFIYLFLLFALWFMSSRLTAAMESNVQRESNLGFSSPIAITSHMTRPHCVCYLSDLLLFFLSSKKILRSFSFNLRSFGCHGMRRRSPCLALAPRWSSLTNHGHARPSWPSHHFNLTVGRPVCHCHCEEAHGSGGHQVRSAPLGERKNRRRWTQMQCRSRRTR